MIMLLKQVSNLVTDLWSLFSQSLSSSPLSNNRLVLQFVLHVFYNMNISLLKGNLHKSLHNKYIIISLKKPYIKYNIILLESSGNSHLTTIIKIFTPHQLPLLFWWMNDVKNTMNIIKEMVIKFSFLLLILCLWSSWNILHCTKRY